MNNMINISASPHTRDSWTTQKIMFTVVLTLMPATIMGVIFHGIHALWVILASVIAAVGTEFVFDKICKKKDTWKDGSAIVTGLLLALSLPGNVPLYLPILGSIFAILVVKCFFGGLGKNFINPALAGRCFLLISFSMTATTYIYDGVSTATPLAVLKAGDAVNVTRMFLGDTSGVIGTSVVALLAGGLVLWALDLIHGEICFSVIIGFTLFMGIFGGQGFDPKFLLAHLCGGGVIMGAFFMATDYTTSPISKLGQMTYGCIIGVLGGLFRCFGGAADSFSYAIVIGNLLTPLIDTYVVPTPFAYRKEMIALQNGEPKKSLKERIPKPVVVLAVITLVAGVALSGVYTLTKDTIDEQKRAQAAASYLEVVPSAEAIVTDETLDQAIADLGGQVYGSGYGRVFIKEAVVGKDAAGNTVGYAVSVQSMDGYDGGVTISLGLDLEGRVTGIAFTELHETPGMGMLCGDPEFKDQFVGRFVDAFTLNKSGGGTSEEEINSVSGASTTSGAVVNAVNAGLDFFNNHMKGGN